MHQINEKQYEQTQAIIFCKGTFFSPFLILWSEDTERWCIGKEFQICGAAKENSLSAADLKMRGKPLAVLIKSGGTSHY